MNDVFSGKSKGSFYFIWIVVGLLLVKDVDCYKSGLSPGTSEAGSLCGGGRVGVLDITELDIVLSWMPDEMKNPDQVCLAKLGTGSGLCREEYSGNYTGICEALWCRDPGLDQCIQVPANDGMPCADDKWCRDGVCQYSEIVSHYTEFCQFGDSKTYSSDGLSCWELVKSDKRKCYDVITERMCCKSCKDVNMNKLGCRYGDKVDGCLRDNCFMMSTNQLQQCCETCGFLLDIVTQTPITQPPTTPTSQPTKQRSSPTTQTTKNSVATQTTKTSPTTQKTKNSVATQATKSSQTTQATKSSQTTQATKNSQTTQKTKNSPTTQTTNSSQTTQATNSSQTTQATNSSPTTQTTKISQTTQATNSSPTTPIRESIGSSTTRGSSFESESTREPVTSDSTVSSEGTVETMSPTTARGSESSSSLDTSSQQSTVNSGESDAQQANVVAIGTGAGVGGGLLIIIVIIVVYVIRKRVTSLRNMQQPNQQSADDASSVGGDSVSALMASMGGTSTTWYPDYRATHTLAN